MANVPALMLRRSHAIATEIAALQKELAALKQAMKVFAKAGVKPSRRKRRRRKAK